jgi:hypothetical protein
VVQLLDLGLLLRVLLAVVVLEELALFGGDALQGLVDDPRALVVLDVCADLAEDLGVRKGIQVVVLCLEVLAHGDQNVVRSLQVLGRGGADVVEGQGDREVEGVVGRLVDDDEGELVEAKVVEIHVVFWGGQEVAQLAALGLEGDFVEELDHVEIALFLAEVLLQEHVDGRLEHEGVVDGDHADLGGEVPAGAAAARLGRVHDVVGHEEEGLQQLDHPSQQRGAEVVLRGRVQGLVAQNGRGVDDGHAAVALPADGVVVERLRHGVSMAAAAAAAAHVGGTFVNQSSDCWGSLYCAQWACRSATMRGQTASNSRRVVGILGAGRRRTGHRAQECRAVGGRQRTDEASCGR